MQKFASCYALLCPTLDYLPPNQNFLLSRSSIVPSQCSSHTTPRRQVKYSQQGKCASPLVFCTANSHCKLDKPLQIIPFSFFLLFFFLFGPRKNSFIDLSVAPETISLPTDQVIRCQGSKFHFPACLSCFSQRTKEKRKCRAYQQVHFIIISKLPGATQFALIRNLNLMEFLHILSFC